MAKEDSSVVSFFRNETKPSKAEAAAWKKSKNGLCSDKENDVSVQFYGSLQFSLILAAICPRALLASCKSALPVQANTSGFSLLCATSISHCSYFTLYRLKILCFEKKGKLREIPSPKKGSRSAWGQQVNSYVYL